MRKENPADIAIFEENAKRPFGMRDKIGYAAGDFANDLTFVIAALFMMKFYTDIMGVSAALVGTLMMVAKVVDAFRSRTLPWGRWSTAVRTRRKENLHRGSAVLPDRSPWLRF